MGIGADAVLDPGLNVKGIAQLWVADNSVIPGVPRGHTAATALIIAEHGSRLILSQLSGTEAESLQPPRESRECQKMQNDSV